MKCTQCGKEIKKASGNWTCPSCNSPISINEIEDAVGLVLAKEGKSVISKSSYFMSLLFDLAPQFKDEVLLIQSAVNCGVYSRILAADKKSNSHKKDELQKCISALLSTGAFDDRKAIKVISILTNCLGWEPDLLGIKSNSAGSSLQPPPSNNVITKPKVVLFANITGALKTAVWIVLAFILIIVLLLSKSCSNSGSTNNNNSSNNQWTSGYEDNDSTTENDDSTISSGGTTEAPSGNTQQPTDGNTQRPTDDNKDTEGNGNTTPKPPINQTVTGTSVSGSLSTEDQVVKYDFTAPKDGRYRFDLGISDTKANYDVSIKDSKNIKVVSGSYYGSDHGFSANLEAGKTYEISVSQDYLMCDYTISIGIPNDIKTVTGESFSGSIKYIDQEDFYNYTAPKAGLYRFDFDTTDVKANYKVKITDTKNTSIGSASYSSSSHGLTVRLNANETYKIKVEQDYLTCDYSINIGVPTDTQAINGNKITGTIRYEDQENTYTYVAPRTGLYHFDFDTSDVSANYSFKIVNSKNAKVCSTNYSASKLNGSTVTLEEGMTYTIIVGYDFKTCDYEVSIGVPNGVQQVSGNTITGSISYRDQENTYKYTATQTGTYVFKLGISNKNADYNIKIKTSNNSSKGSGHYAWDYFDGIETNLTAGETYTIIISYEYLTCDYTVDITLKAD